MTSIAIWLNKEEGECIWAASDSRITGDKSKKMTDNCPKLFTVPIQIHTDQSQVMQLKIASLGYCYSGSSLIGQTSHIKLTELLSKLLPITEKENKLDYLNNLPSVFEIANLLKKLAEESLREMCDYKFNIMATEKFGSELAIFGYCHQAKSHKCFSLKNTPDNQGEFLITEVDLYSNRFYLLGDIQTEVGELINEEYESHIKESLKWWRSPCYALENIVLDENYQSIGGRLQLCRAHKFGADVIFHVTKENVMDGVYRLGGFISTPRKMTP